MKKIKKSKSKETLIVKSIKKLAKKVDKMTDEQIKDVSNRLGIIIDKTDVVIRSVKKSIKRKNAKRN